MAGLKATRTTMNMISHPKQFAARGPQLVALKYAQVG